MRKLIPCLGWVALLAVGTQALHGQGNAPVGYAAALTAPGERIDVLAKPARLQVEEVSVLEALEGLMRSSGVQVAYSPTLLPQARVVTCNCENTTVGEAIRLILRDTPLEYLVVAEQVVVRRTPSQNRVPSAFLASIPRTDATRSLAEAATPAVERTRVGTVTGRVVETETGRPLAAVQVSIAGRTAGAATQADGRYTIPNVPAGRHSLVARRVGYATVTREVVVADNASATLDFSLPAQALALDQLVVTGTPGATQRRAVGNVVGRVAVAELAELAPVLNVEQMLGSKVPGMVSITSSGTVGADASLIRLRASSSASLAGNPLVYVDGVRINSEVQGGRDSGVSRLTDINPADIESIEVIKGPAASTLYGTEAANGVIQIITKKGRSGAPAFDVSTEWGESWLPDLKNTVPVNYGTAPDGRLLSMHLPTAEKERGLAFLQRGPLQRHSLSVRGGTEVIRYFGSYSRTDQEGIVSWNWDKSNSGRMSLGIRALGGLDVDLAMSYLSRETRFPGGWWANMTRGTPLTAADYGGADSPLRGWDQVPELLRDGSDERTEVSRTGVSLTLQAEPTSWLTGRVVAGLDRTDAIAHNVTPRREADSPFGEELGSSDVDNNDDRFQSLDVSATAKWSPMSFLETSTSGGLQYNQRRSWSYSASGDEFASPVLTTVGTAARTSGSENYEENVGAGFYVQEALDWDNRIFLTGAVRMDDNSAFGEDFDAAIYPKLSAAWVLSDEGFFNVAPVSSLRLRSAWGAAGRQPNLFDAARVYAAVTGAGDRPSLTPSGYGNPSLGPERGEEIELGFDASFLDDRVNLEFTRYHRVTTDAIISRALAPSVGFPGNQLQNIGQISGWGTETKLDLQVLEERPFGWSLSFGFATMHNRIDDMGGIDRIPVGRSRQHIEGYPLASAFNIKILSADFVSGNSGRVTNIMCDGGTGADGRREGGAPVPCASAPLLYMGPGEPTWNVNLTSTFSLPQDIELYTNLDARGGNIQHNDGIAARHTSWSNSLAAQLKDDPIFMAYTQVDRARLGTYDAGFARLREVGLRYALPGALTDRLHADRMAISIAARNLPYLWRAQTHTSIGDELIPSPEVVISSGQFFGESHSSQPPTTLVTVALKATF
jgi:TonB-dependent SusC/RagA subfamily outer membrane receptor